MQSIRFKTLAVVVASVAFAEFLNFLIGPFGMPKGKNLSDLLFLVLLLLHGVWVYRLVAANRRQTVIALFRTPEVLFVVTLVLFLLSYIFASGANLDYLQRFAAAKGNLHLEPSTGAERVNSLSRFVPLFAVQIWTIVWFRLRHPRLASEAIGSSSFAATWGLALSMLSAFLFTIAFPSFVSLEGFGALAFIALVPLFLVFYRSSYGRSVFYGVGFGVVETLLTNYWLGTFRLVSLQLVTLLMALQFAAFMLIMLLLFKRMPRIGFLVLPVAWVAFDWLKSLGYLGYPWDMIGATQYRFHPFIQIASVTGIWGVSFMVLAANSVIAHAMYGYRRRKEAAVGDGGEGAPVRRAPWRRFLLPVWLYVVAFFLVFVYGNISAVVQADKPVRRVVRIALIQQNTDPQTSKYATSLSILKKLTDKALFYHPDLVVWSEAAFVPNIRKWSRLDPHTYPLAKLVDQFLAYDKELGHWLVTGNDDSTAIPNARHEIVRREFDSSVLFSASGRRMQTYHKIHNVPFTEEYGHRKRLPLLARLLPSFDANFRGKGQRYVVFRTPKLKFSTPLGFEDAFPNDVRHFVLSGAQMIIALSNDYFAQTPIEGQQHFMNSLFRAIENRRPLLRDSSSGLTGYVDTSGRLIAAAPYYKQAYLVITVPLKVQHETLYTRIGDWFPKLCITLLVIFSFFGISRRRAGGSDAMRRSRRRAP